MLLAFAAAVAPVTRWCPLRWEQIDRDALLKCAVLPISTMASCSVFQALAHDAARDGRVSCPMAADGCEATSTCPMRAPARKPASNPTADHRGRGHAFCLDEPFMASAQRAPSPSLDHAVMQATIVATIAALTPPVTVEHAAPAPEARPPTAPPAARPPIRGPPSLLS